MWKPIHGHADWQRKVDNKALKSGAGNEDGVWITEVITLLLAFIGLDSPVVKVTLCAESVGHPMPNSNLPLSIVQHFQNY